ncbi:ferrous iron transporter B [bacterium]|nr:ferrous iron transporter B [bacterium]
MPKRTIVLVGVPNSGKTTLFNQLTGQHAKMVNYPGSTTDFCLGRSLRGSQVIYVDTPGIHSLKSVSKDEEIALSCLTCIKKLSAGSNDYPDLVISVIDLNQASRHLYLTLELIKHGYPVVVVATMKDLADQAKVDVDLSLLSEQLNCSVFHINAMNLDEVVKVQATIETMSCKPYVPKDYDFTEKSIKETFKSVETILGLSKYKRIESKQFDLDTLFLHPVLAPFLFVGIMGVFFYGIFACASPFMGFVEWVFLSLNQFIASLFPDMWVTQLLTEGIVNGFAAVVVFVPQIALLFFGIGLLESTGYLARGAVLVDKPLSWVGLNGRCFVPLLSGFSCAIPAMLATRNIQQQKTKLLCCFIIPLMQCSARLPVYGLLLTMLFGDNFLYSAVVFTSLYVGSLLLAAFVALIAGKFIPGKTQTQFNIELPTWKAPNWKNIWYQVVRQTRAFVFGAGPMIMGVSIVLWLLATYPTQESSYAMLIGKWIEPLVSPMGLDWRVGVAIILSFAAREVFVSALVVLFSIGGNADSIVRVLSQATFQGSTELLFTPASMASLLVFFMIAMQCGATLAIAKKEMNSNVYPAVQLVVYIVMAYGASIGIYNLISLIS